MKNLRTFSYDLASESERANVRHIFSRQGYIKDFQLFVKVFEASSPQRANFNNSFGGKATEKMHRLNCFLQYNLHGITNHYVLSKRPAFVNFTLYETKRVTTIEHKEEESNLKMVDDCLISTIKTSPTLKTEIIEYKIDTRERFLEGSKWQNKKITMKRKCLTVDAQTKLSSCHINKMLKLYRKLALNMSKCKNEYRREMLGHKIESTKLALVNFIDDYVSKFGKTRQTVAALVAMKIGPKKNKKFLDRAALEEKVKIPKAVDREVNAVLISKVYKATPTLKVKKLRLTENLINSVKMEKFKRLSKKHQKPIYASLAEDWLKTDRWASASSFRRRLNHYLDDNVKYAELKWTYDALLKKIKVDIEDFRRFFYLRDFFKRYDDCQLNPDDFIGFKFY